MKGLQEKDIDGTKYHGSFESVLHAVSSYKKRS